MTATMERPAAIDPQEPKPLPNFTATVARRDLANALRLPVEIATSRTSLPVLRCVRLAMKVEALFISASDLEIESEARCEATGEGVACVDAHRFSQVVASLPEGEVSLAMAGQQLEIRCRSTRLLLPARDPEDFPDTTTTGAEKWELPGTDFAALLRAVIPAVHTDDTRPVLVGAYLISDGENLICVATDTRVLHVAKVAANAPENKSLIPSRALSLFTKHLDADCSWEVSASNHLIEITDGVTRIISRLTSGQFPPYERVIPTASSATWEFSLEDLLLSLKRLRTVEEKTALYHGVTMTPEVEGGISLRSRTGEGEVTDRIEGACASERFSMVFAAKELEKTLSAFKALAVSELRFTLTDPRSPVLVEAKTDCALRAVIVAREC